MYLSREQELLTKGEHGPAFEWAMKELVRLGDQVGSERLIKISSVHIPDWCEKRSSEAWEWLASIDGKAQITITANPQGMDDPVTMGRERTLERLHPNHAYTCSCTPYLFGNHPVKGEVVAWGGRAASAFVNSVLGARSEVESFESAVASAITGLTPERGLHLEKNRQATVSVLIKGESPFDYLAMGWKLSHVLSGEVPLICGVRPNYDEAKKMASSINAAGKVPLFYMQKDPNPPAHLEVIEMDGKEMLEGRVSNFTPDISILGCPHLSEQEINKWSSRLGGGHRLKIEAWFFTSQLCKDKSLDSLERHSSLGKVFTNRCALGMCHRLIGKKIACDSPVLADHLRERGIEARYVPDRELLSLMCSSA
jgi:predicted aconitase